ncbi:heat-inducible transcriptional repressor HrcA [Scatolibacter rhodanostii]|uniref:heat-inducible transcriptional repressor HrcA n=1 Tax=Scatolibacter rhodanostii TaxID=2014781 RepID=UPI000C07495A|nr:heat-inducible transcriptional repressor HrcA [Scatolibacter rhodanostii]
MQLTDRKRKILSCIVSEFVSGGEPVGSKVIAEEIGVSSATVRNEMAELIEMGLLSQPHTSAGRIPSQTGYREYVNHLTEPYVLSEKDKKFLDSALLNEAYDMERLLKGAARVLSVFSKSISIVSTSGGRSAKIRAVQFVQIARRSAMLILMSSAGTVKSEIFHCDFDLTADITRVLFRAFNEKLSGVPIISITMPFIQTLAASMKELSILTGAAMVALLNAAQKTAKAEIFVDGQMNLLFYPDFEQGEIRVIVDYLQHEEKLAPLLQNESERASVSIGHELQQSALTETSLVVSRYAVGGHDTGAIAVLGPLRMNYPKLIAAVEYTSAQVGEILTMLTYTE